MASSGTVSLNINFRQKPPRPRESVMLAGYGQLKSTAVIEAGDLVLRTIKSFIATPYYTSRAKGGPVGLYGSVNTSGSLMNAVTLRTLQGSVKTNVGTTHTGTIAGGTIQVSFIATGA